jgi:hypothetical protein
MRFATLFRFSACLVLASSLLGVARADKKEKFIYDSKGKRDPFFPITSVREEAVKERTQYLSPRQKLEKKGIVVTSIVWDPVNPAILINDDILEIGDTVQGVIIRAIEQDYVVFEVDGELVEVPLV